MTRIGISSNEPEEKIEDIISKALDEADILNTVYEVTEENEGEQYVLALRKNKKW